MSFFSQTKYSKVETSFYEPVYGNYRFDTDLTNFGILHERKIRKVNVSGSILKLAEDLENKSVYPMLDEFGYTIHDFFIFKSSWDFRYHVETRLPAPQQFGVASRKDIFRVEETLRGLGEQSITIGRTSPNINNQTE